jgi:creatinine amidohydrolase
VRSYPLRVDTDINCACEVARRAADRVDRVLAAPPIWSGFSPEHQGFPGSIYLRLETILSLLTNVCHAKVSHGFRKIVLLKSHGGNSALIWAFSKQFLHTHGVAVVYAKHWAFVAEQIATIRRSGRGGMRDARELETSLRPFFWPEHVDMNEAKVSYEDSVCTGVTSIRARDMFEAATVWMPRDYAITDPQGTVGDPAVATSEMGRCILQAEPEGLVSFPKEVHQSDTQSC